MALLLLRFLFRQELAQKPRNIEALAKLDQNTALHDRESLTKILIVLGGVILLFFLHNRLHLQPAFVALLGASVALVWVQPDVDEVLRDVEWSVLLFFAALFVAVGGLQSSGLLNWLAEPITALAGQRLLLTGVVLIWVSALLSAAVDNVPFTIVMIPIILDLGATGVNITPLWWALALGAGFGGNGTPIGSTANVVTVSVGNETSLFGGNLMPLNCLEGYITEVRENVTQPTTANDDYTFYAGETTNRPPDTVLPLIDFVAIHMYPITNYRQWDWRQEGVASGPLRAEAMMNESLAVAQANYQSVYDYEYIDASGATVTIGETFPIVVGETGWKWRQTNIQQEIETYAADPVNAKWYYDLMLGWERTPGGPPTIFIFNSFERLSP